MNTDAVIRKVGGTIRSADVLETETVRIEYIRRDSEGTFRWHFRNPQMCLFWFREGAKMLRGTMSGTPVEKAFHGSDTFALYPAGVEIDGEWTTARRLDYAVVFLPCNLVDAHMARPIREPVLAFRDTWLAGSLNELRGKAGHDDDASRHCASNWALQAMARLRTRLDEGESASGDDDAVMTAWQIRKLGAHIDANLDDKLTTDDLAAVIGISRRHFSRVFTKTFGTSPHRYLTGRRIDRAVTLLSETALTISDIALETGFGNSQHFASAFKCATGRTASRVRHEAHSIRGLDMVTSPRDMARFRNRGSAGLAIIRQQTFKGATSYVGTAKRRESS